MGAVDRRKWMLNFKSSMFLPVTWRYLHNPLNFSPPTTTFFLNPVGSIPSAQQAEIAIHKHTYVLPGRCKYLHITNDVSVQLTQIRYSLGERPSLSIHDFLQRRVSTYLDR